MGKHMALEQAQALLEKATANANEPQVVEQEQTAPVVERAIQQPEAIPVPVQEPVVVQQEPQQVVAETKPDVSSEISELKARLDKAENAYKSLQGKYNKELPEARNSNAQLQAEISSLKDQLYKQASAQQEIPKVGVKEYLGQDMVDELGENYVNMADSVTDFKINQALENERKRYELEIEELKKVQKQEKWNRYNQSVASQIPNFIELVDPYGNGTIDEEFGQFLQANYMLQAFDDADLNMNSQVVIDICSKFNSYKNPVVQTEAPVQAPVANPKAQAIAPPTSNNASPQSKPSTPKFTHSVRDYIDKGQEFARGNMTTDAWLKYQASYDKAMAEGKVQR